MKKFLLTTAAFGMLALPAMAADMAPAPAPIYKAPVPVPVCLWCGFYIGADVGGFGSEQSASTRAYPSGFGAPAIPGAGFAGIGILPTTHSLNSDGFLGGVHAGYNWQVTPSFKRHPKLRYCHLYLASDGISKFHPKIEALALPSGLLHLPNAFQLRQSSSYKIADPQFSD